MARESEKQAGAALQRMHRAEKSARPPTPRFCGDIGLKIGRDGTWYYRDSPIKRKPLVKLFSTVLRKEDDGTYYLVTPVEKVSIAVEESPFLAVAMEVTGEGREQRLDFTTNLDEQVTADADHPLSFRPGAGQGYIPFVAVRGGLTARLVRPVYYQLVELAVEETEGLGVWSGGRFFRFPQTG
jgi:uncharacterized protein